MKEHTMRNTLLAAVVALLLAPAAAFAQSDINQHSSSNSGAGAEAIIENLNGGGSGSDGGYYGSHGNNVDAVAPTMYSNDTCGSAVAGAASFLGIGISAGATSEIKGCVQRQWFILMQTTAMKTGISAYGQWAINIACATPAIASQAPAGVCPGSVATAAPAAIIAPKPVAYEAPRAEAVAQRPDWCQTWGPGDGTLPAVCR